MQLMGTKHYPVRMFSDGMDDFVMDEKTLNTTPGVAGLQSVAMTTMSRRVLNCCFKLNNESVISFTQILFIMPVLKLRRRTV